MADVSETLQAKSDQLNATDIIGVEPVIKVREVRVSKSAEQPVWIYYHGDNNKPWKPSKGMRRILAAAWGRESDKWIGKSVKLFFEPSVRYAGQEVGGIRIRAVSDIASGGINCAWTLSKTKREPYHVALLPVQSSAYPDDKFEAALPAMKKKMEDGEMSLAQIVAQCQKTGELTAAQLAQLEQAAPVEIETHEDEEEVY